MQGEGNSQDSFGAMKNPALERSRAGFAFQLWSLTLLNFF
ncbi:hypothetical protein IMCC13023_03390 [Candidatus Aquiluna sp. IMCC13023]|nr:hypothetical protein IMCC13023_03390 [Candidatus Aquiluna sp. IMCC13023]